MGFLSDTVSYAAEFRSHPALRAEQCLNRLQRRSPCTRCAENCPHGVFPLKSGEDIQWNRCTDCGLCTAVCPTRALIPSEPARRVYAEALEGRTVSITCRQEEESGTLCIGCLAAVPWELLAVYALCGKLTLYMRACAACPHEKQKTLLEDNIEMLNRFLGAERFAEQVQLIDREHTPPIAPEEPETKAITRRELFSGIRCRAERQLYKEAEKRLPLLIGEKAGPLAWRRLLSETVKTDCRKNAEQHYGILLPRFNLNCFGCGICEKVCPHQALSIVREEGGTRLVYIEPLKCTACTLCVWLCPHKGLDGLTLISVPHLEKLPLVRVKSVSCEKCGTVLLPKTDPPLCRRCAKAATLHKR